MPLPKPSTRHGLPSAVRWSHLLLESHLKTGDTAIDATAGNGHDTLFLARLVGPEGHVFAMDVQAAAIQETCRRLNEQGVPAGTYTLLHSGHERLHQVIPTVYWGKIHGIMFNLGWLPGSDKSVITGAATTLPALEAALAILAPAGLLTLAVYPGHEGGREELRAITEWAENLPTRSFEVQQLRPVNPAASPPECWVIWKKPG